jgi:hypothetical protein
MRTLAEKTFAMEVEGVVAKPIGGVLLPVGTLVRRETHIGFHPLDGARVYRIEATLDGSAWRVFHIDGIPRTVEVQS